MSASAPAAVCILYFITFSLFFFIFPSHFIYFSLFFPSAFFNFFYLFIFFIFPFISLYFAFFFLCFLNNLYYFSLIFFRLFFAFIIIFLCIYFLSLLLLLHLLQAFFACTRSAPRCCSSRFAKLIFLAYFSLFFDFKMKNKLENNFLTASLLSLLFATRMCSFGIASMR